MAFARYTWHSSGDIVNIRDTLVYEIDTILTATTSVFEWQNVAGDIVTLTGTFSYSGMLPSAMSTVTDVEIDLISSGTGVDYTHEYNSGVDFADELTSGTQIGFWDALQGADDEVVIDALGVFVDLTQNLTSGYSTDSHVGNVANQGADRVTITNGGTFSLDGLRGLSNAAADDTASVERTTEGSDLFVAGDHLYAALSASRTLVGGNDTIEDTSVEGGLTYLVGDVGEIYASISLYGGNDTITVSKVDAVIVGDIYRFSDASESLTLWGGDDTLSGGTGDDVIVGDIYDVDFNTEFVNVIKGGDDVIYGGDGADVIYGEYAESGFGSFSGGMDTIDGGAGADTIYGQSGADVVKGGGNADYIAGGGGGDALSGNNGADDILGDSGADTLWGNRGDDSLSGGQHGDTLFGGRGQDDLKGGSGNDVLSGGRNGDTLDGGTGDDTLTGDQAADVFVFGDGDGDDVITDFEVNKSGEAIDLADVSEITDYADLVANHLQQVGSDVVIDSLAGETVTVQGVALADLSTANFLF